jgi:hypothetical protein
VGDVVEKAGNIKFESACMKKIAPALRARKVLGQGCHPPAS